MSKPLLALLLATTVAPAADADLKAFHAGVKAVGCTGSPGAVVVFGPTAFPVVTDGSPAANPAVAAGTLGQGRVVAFGHSSFLSAEAFKIADTQAFVTNAAKWAAGNAEPKIVTLGDEALARLLGGESVKAIPAFAPGLVLVAAPSRVTVADAKPLKAFVEAGGGLLAGTPGWGWLQLNPGKTIAEGMPLNGVLAAAGLSFGTGFLEGKASAGCAVTPPSKFAHSGEAVAAVETWLTKGAAPPPGEAEAIRAAINRIAGAVPAEFADPLMAKLTKALDGAAKQIPVPTAKAPLGAKDTLGRLLFALSVQLAKPGVAHPAATAFPGPVPKDAKRVTKTVSFTADSTGYICNGVGVSASADIWHSTGLYAAPGEAVTVQMVTATVAAGCSVQIGGHTDHLWGLTSWKRAPDVVRRVKAAGETTTISNPFGGLIYILVPVKAKPGKVGVTVSNAVEAPRFVRGVHADKDWKALRGAPAPWAEFEGRNAILTVPSEAARKVENPEELLAFWDTVLDADADLTAVPRARGRKERLMHDVQISAGYMHSGYPIMSPLGEVSTGLDVAKMKRDGAWGYFHELGHNHQQPMWTFDGGTEVTCNLYSLYCYATLCPDAPLHGDMLPAKRKANAAKYLAAGAKFETWKQEPFTALLFYFQLQQEFGWDTFKAVFAEYQALPAKDRPKTDAEERDQWLVRMSKTTGKNLTPLFEYWGVPASAAAKAAVAALPAWTPPDATK